jgi:hypothetical protein
MIAVNTCTYTALFPELACADDGPLQVDHDSDLDLSELLGLLDHFNKHLVFFVLNGAHVDAEDVCTLLY